MCAFWWWITGTFSEQTAHILQKYPKKHVYFVNYCSFNYYLNALNVFASSEHDCAGNLITLLCMMY